MNICCCMSSEKNAVLSSVLMLSCMFSPCFVIFLGFPPLKQRYQNLKGILCFLNCLCKSISLQTLFCNVDCGLLILLPSLQLWSTKFTDVSSFGVEHGCWPLRPRDCPQYFEGKPQKRGRRWWASLSSWAEKQEEVGKPKTRKPSEMEGWDYEETRHTAVCCTFGVTEPCLLLHPVSFLVVGF